VFGDSVIDDRMAAIGGRAAPQKFAIYESWRTRWQITPPIRRYGMYVSFAVVKPKPPNGCRISEKFLDAKHLPTWIGYQQD